VRHPDASLDELRAVVLALLRGEAPAAEQKTMPEPVRRKDSAQDLRLIANSGTAYAGLLAAKVITPPANDPLVTDPALDCFGAAMG